MLELSKIIYSGLKASIAINEVVGTKIFPLLADQEVDFPFIVYRVEQLETKTKDRSVEYLVTILSFQTTYDLALELSEKIQDTMKLVAVNNKSYRFVKTSAAPFLTEDRQIYVEQKFNIIK